jgi:hypothetical protein
MPGWCDSELLIQCHDPTIINQPEKAKPR